MEHGSAVAQIAGVEVFRFSRGSIENELRYAFVYGPEQNTLIP